MSVCYIYGAMPTQFRPTLRPGDLVIAADAGLRQLGNIRPDLIVGDFDSLGYIPEGAEVIRHPVRKDDTDTLLAVRCGLERGYCTFVLLGGMGGRLDHTLANLQTLQFIAAHGARGFLQGDEECATVIDNETVTLAGKSGRVSVFALDKEVRGVWLTGLDYPLTDAVLTDQFPLGVSNAFTGETAHIAAAGRLLLVWDGPYSLFEKRT